MTLLDQRPASADRAASAPRDGASTSWTAASDTAADGSAPHDTASGTPSPEKTAARLRAGRALAAVAVIGGPLLLGIGFYLSFGNLSTAASERFGFAPGAQAILFSICVDAAIVVFLAADLAFVAHDLRPWRWLRPAAHVMAASTIVLNSIAHGLTNWEKSLPHSLPPFLAVLLVEAGRDYLVQVAALERGETRAGIPWHRWPLHPFETSRIFRVMQQWEMPYETVREQRRALAIHEVWLSVQPEFAAAEAEEDPATREAALRAAQDRLPSLLAPHGVSMAEALALPDRKRAEEARRVHETAQRARQLELEQAQLDHAAKLADLAHQKELAAMEADVSQTQGVAGAEARGAVAAAEARAAANVRAVTAETDAFESRDVAEAAARAAEAKTRAAEAAAEEAEAESRAAEAAARVAETAAREAEARTAVAEADRLTAAKKEATAKANLAAEQLNQRAAETKAAAAEARLRAAEADDATNMSKPKREARRLARIALDEHGGDVAAVEGVAEMFGVSPATATARRTEAAQLIAEGFRG
ncbi:DUF2637 domain-containing protein [Streptomyces virginiae]|uniref:DUF2637 domain-containing protein n=1 Tax=Streptomyces virginiae TaxID=1961 RepID=A0ABZ1TU06_STRVG|nr:DUF2637 domain-containing protein [Streptomyces virginiae]